MNLRDELVVALAPFIHSPAHGGGAADAVLLVLETRQEGDRMNDIETRAVAATSRFLLAETEKAETRARTASAHLNNVLLALDHFIGDEECIGCGCRYRLHLSGCEVGAARLWWAIGHEMADE